MSQKREPCWLYLQDSSSTEGSSLPLRTLPILPALLILHCRSFVSAPWTQVPLSHRQGSQAVGSLLALFSQIHPLRLAPSSSFNYLPKRLRSWNLSFIQSTGRFEQLMLTMFFAWHHRIFWLHYSSAPRALPCLTLERYHWRQCTDFASGWRPDGSRLCFEAWRACLGHQWSW